MLKINSTGDGFTPSRYQSVISSALRESGGDLFVLSRDFSELVASTQIVTGRGKYSVSYFDRYGGYLCGGAGSVSDADDFPRLGKVTEVHKDRDYTNAYEKQQCFNMHLKLSYSKNEDVIAFLKAQPNKQGFIVELLRKELKRLRQEDK